MQKYYNIEHTKVGPFEQGEHVREEELLALGAQMDRLIGLGAITEVPMLIPEDGDVETESDKASDISANTVDDLRRIALSLGVSPVPRTKAGLVSAIEIARERTKTAKAPEPAATPDETSTPPATPPAVEPPVQEQTQVQVQPPIDLSTRVDA